MYRFDKSRRLLNKSDYENVFNQAKRVVNSDFIALYRSNGVGHARLGLAISKKIIAKAHDRNRVKRMLRETFRRQQLPAVDIIILAKKGVVDVQNSLIISRLIKLWGSLGMSK